MQLPSSISANVLQNCRQSKISLGAAIVVLSYVASSRVLHRRYLRGEISEEEWDFMKKQPTHSRGPLNTRPYLDKDWYEGGGFGEVFVALTYFTCTLPSFPSPAGFQRNSATKLLDSAPAFVDLLSHERFIHRCNSIKDQMREETRHPLFMDIGEIRQRAFLASKRNIYLQWRAGLNDQAFQSKASVNGLKHDEIYNYEWTTIGDVSCLSCRSGGFFYLIKLHAQYDSIMPLHYPLPPTHPLSPQRHPTQRSVSPQVSGETLLHILDSGPIVHPRPTDFYLSVSSSRGHIKFSLLWDRNVYANELMSEWLDEVLAATEWYLGGEMKVQGRL